MGNNNTFDSFPCCIRIGGYLVKKGIEMKKDVADTGSTDKTVGIAGEAGARGGVWVEFENKRG